MSANLAVVVAVHAPCVDDALAVVVAASFSALTRFLDHGPHLLVLLLAVVVAASFSALTRFLDLGPHLLVLLLVRDYLSLSCTP